MFSFVETPIQRFKLVICLMTSLVFLVLAIFSSFTGTPVVSKLYGEDQLLDEQLDALNAPTFTLQRTTVCWMSVTLSNPTHSVPVEGGVALMDDQWRMAHVLPFSFYQEYAEKTRDHVTDEYFLLEPGTYSLEAFTIDDLIAKSASAEHMTVEIKTHVWMATYYIFGCVGFLFLFFFYLFLLFNRSYVPPDYPTTHQDLPNEAL